MAAVGVGVVYWRAQQMTTLRRTPHDASALAELTLEDARAL
jgi:hypothetical protein